MYKQSIILFGIILPLLGLAAVIGGLYFLKLEMSASYTTKAEQYKIYSKSQAGVMEIENKISRQRPHLARWKQELSAETTSAVRTQLKVISEHLPSKEFQETAFDPLSGNSGLGSSTTQKSSQLRLGFRGTFRTVQRALIELETRLPQLQLQEIKIDPSPQSNLLNFQVTYTAWEN
jgi:hypothetical protein